MKLFGLAACAVAVLLTPATAQEGAFMDQDRFVRAVDLCIAANLTTEFDTAEDVLTRVKGSCELMGTVRFPARGNPILGDILRYDAARSLFVWNSQLDSNNRFFGGGLSPYRLGTRLDSSGRGLDSSHLPPEIAAALTGVGNAHFWLLPIFRTELDIDTYEASNAFGAERVVQRSRETRYGLATHIPSDLNSLLVMEAPFDPATARDLADNLDIAITFQVGEACPFCYKSTTVQRDSRPTASSPFDVAITNHVILVNVLNMYLIDRRNGAVVFASVPASSGSLDAQR